MLVRAQRVAAEDGTEVSVFDATGRHTQTLHGLTGQTLLTFAYDPQGHLTVLTDADGNRTAIDRDARGHATGMRSPYGQRTTLTINAAGLLRPLQHPTKGTSTMTSGHGRGILAHVPHAPGPGAHVDG